MEAERLFVVRWVVLVTVVMGVFGPCDGNNFMVGGNDGWVQKPREEYGHWAHRLRFQVNDTLHFKYNKESDSVLLVRKEDFDSCNSKNPSQSLTDGDSTFKFDKSGPYYFITGNAENCNKGQKLIVVVMAVRAGTGGHHHQTPPPSPYPSPVASPPAAATPNASPSPTPAAATPNASPSPTPAAATPKTSPSPTPAAAPGMAEMEAPAPSHLESGSTGLGCSFGLVLVYSVVVGLVLGLA